MSTTASVRLLEADQDLGRFLNQEELEQASELFVPVVSLSRGAFDADSLIRGANAFGAIVLEGILLMQLQISEHAVARLVGPGDYLSLAGRLPSTITGLQTWRATTQTRLALLEDRALLMCRRWPRLVAGLYARMGDQQERVAIQLAICQLPRVEERLLAILWLLAESWGRVTRAGTALPLSLTHDVLGALVGARRPTVTLALGQLTRRGAILQHDDGWLLLESPSMPTRSVGEALEAAPIEPTGSAWADVSASAVKPQNDWIELLATVTRLRAEHEQRVTALNAQLCRFKRSRMDGERSRRGLRKEHRPGRGRSPS